MSNALDDPFRWFLDASPAEIQRAHDVLHAIVSGEVHVPLQPQNMRLLHATYDVLCWVLGHQCGDTFRCILNTALEAMRCEGVKSWQSHPPA